MSPPEVKLWSLLRGSPRGVRFRRQHPIGPFIADFYCPSARLVIEVDGSIHDFEVQAQRDEDRNDYMEKLGLRIVRIPARKILSDTVEVAEGLIAMCRDIMGPSTTQLR